MRIIVSNLDHCLEDMLINAALQVLLFGMKQQHLTLSLENSKSQGKTFTAQTHQMLE